MKKRYRVWIILLSVSSVFAANTMNIVSMSVNAGDVFWLEININNDDEFAGFQCDIDFPESFSYLNDAYLSERENGHTINQSVVSGNVRLFSFSLGTTFDGNSGTVAYAKFQAGSTPGSYDFSLVNDVIISDLSSNNILTAYTNGVITVNEVPTPIELETFIARETAEGIQLMWSTATETENSSFNIYRDDVLITTIRGAGTSSEPHDYTFLDKTARPGVRRYLLSDVSYGGVETRHTDCIVEVQVSENSLEPGVFELFDAYPNPFNPATTVSYELLKDSQIRLSLAGPDGKNIRTLYQGMKEKGMHTYRLDMADVSSGIYILRLQVGEMIQTRKVLLIK